MATKYLYLFSEGNANMRNLLGGKGANLAEMTNIGMPVPQGFTITTEACTQYYADGRWNDIFTSTDNTTNRLSGSVEAVEASRFRLFVAMGEQGGNTARIYEFSLYGRYADESGIADITAAPEYGIELKGNTPNPCHGSTSVLFRPYFYRRPTWTSPLVSLPSAAASSTA